MRIGSKYGGGGMSSTHRMLLISTGGSIAGEVAPDRDGVNHTRNAQDFGSLLGTTFDWLKSRYDVELEMDFEAPFRVDSSNVEPKHWTQLATIIKDRFDEFDSFVITHGTNTLGYTCAALSFALANPNKPIILTGSQVPAEVPGSDGLTNLQNAIRIAVMKRPNGPSLKGIMAVFGSYIITGTRVKKSTDFDYDAFISFGTGSLGRIGRIININDRNLETHVSYLATKHGNPAIRAADLRFNAEFDTRIASLTEFPGMSSDFFKSLVEHNDVRGFILRAFGAGDPCDNHRKAFEWLKGREIPIVVTTQAHNGNSNFQVNEPGKYLRDNELAIPAHDMSIESQTAKLSWLLAKKAKGQISYTQLCEDMITDMHGEIDVKWEIGK